MQAQVLFQTESFTRSGKIAVVQYTDSDKDHHFCGLVRTGPDFAEGLKACLDSHFDEEVVILSDLEKWDGWNIAVGLDDDRKQEIHIHLEQPF